MKVMQEMMGFSLLGMVGRCRLSLTALVNITQIAREIPGKRNHAGKETKAQGGMIYLINRIGM